MRGRRDDPGYVAPMGALLASTLPLALGAAISPTLFALQLMVLSGRTKRLARGWALAAGAAVILGAFAVLCVTLLDRLHQATHHHSVHDAVIDFVAAGLLVALAARSLHHRPTAGEENKERTEGRLTSAPTFWFFGIGAIGMVVNFSTLVLFLAAMHEITRSAVGTTGRVVDFAVVYVVTLLPVLVPVGLVAALGERADPPLRATHAFVADHGRSIGITVEVVFAVYLAVKGVGELP